MKPSPPDTEPKIVDPRKFGQVLDDPKAKLAEVENRGKGGKGGNATQKNNRFG